MRRKGFRVGFGLILAALAAVQLATLAHRRHASAGGRWLQPGDALGGLEVVDTTGAPATLPVGHPTVLLVFDPSCGPCRAVAPAWSRWTREAAATRHVLAVSAGRLQAASDYVRDNEWSAELLLVRPRRPGGLAHALTARTPWVFFLDARGSVVAEGHGSRLPELAATVEALR